jgi:hypothetical protein
VSQFRSIAARASPHSGALPFEPPPIPSTLAISSEHETIVPEKWLEVARAYGKWLNGCLAANAPSVQFGISGVRIDRDDLLSLSTLLQHEYERMAVGDLLFVDVPVTTSGRPDGAALLRDSLATALFRGGFEKPFMWAGSKALVAEQPRGRWLGKLLSAKALGAGPDRLSEIADLVPPPDRIYAIARRSALAPPDQRPLRLSIIMPVYN